MQIVEDISLDTETLVKEINRAQPRKSKSLVSLEGIKEAAIQIGDTAKPIVELAEKVMPYLQLFTG